MGTKRPLSASASRAGDRLRWAHGEGGAEGCWVATDNQARTAPDVEVQVAAGGEELEAAGAVSVAELDDAIVGGGRRAVDHRVAAERVSLEVELDVAEASCHD